MPSAGNHDQATPLGRAILDPVTQPLPPLFTDDIARQSTLAQVLFALQDLSRKVDILMTQDAAVAAAAARIEADEQAVLTALGSQQALITALQAEVAAGSAQLSQATLDALAKAADDMDTLNTQAAADVAADNPAPSGA